MKQPSLPQPERFPSAKQRRMDQLLEKNREGTITARERVRLIALVAEAERLMVRNARRLEESARREGAAAPPDAVPVTVWVTPKSAEP